MSHKARRRPSWKHNKLPDTWELILLCDKTGEFLQRINVTNGRKTLNDLKRKHGTEYVENMLRNELIRLAELNEKDIETEI